MRLSYNDKHLELMGWAERRRQLTREQQRAFLRDARLLARELRAPCGHRRGLLPLGRGAGTSAASSRRSSETQNIEPLVAEVESAMAQIRQNGNPTIVFTHFALSVSKMIKKL